MKHRLHLAALNLITVLVLSACSSIAPGNDPVVVNAERTTVLAVETFDAFNLWEFQNRAALAQWPAIRQAADRIRSDAPMWLASARALTRAYKANRTEANQADLQTVMSVLIAAVNEATTYLAEVPKLTSAPLTAPTP